MKIERFAAEDMSRAIRAVRAEMGSDAVILSNHRVGSQVEVVAASEYDEALFARVPAGVRASVEQATETQTDAAHFGVGTLELQQELEELRNTLRTELSQFQSRGLTTSTACETIASRLQQCGLEKKLSEAIARKATSNTEDVPDWRATLELLGHQISIAPDDLMANGGVFAVLGSTGVGKTTTVVKLAAQFCYRHGRDSVALITTDTHRIGAQEQLEHFARLLNVPIAVAGSSSELIRNVNRFSQKKLVLIDTAGISQRDLDLTRQLGVFSKSLPDVKHLLVLSATAQTGLSQEVIKAFRQVQVESAVLTKIDEAVEIGSVLSGVIKAKLPISYLCDGQNIPEDLEYATKEDLLQTLYQLAQDHSPLRATNKQQGVPAHAKNH